MNLYAIMLTAVDGTYHGRVRDLIGPTLDRSAVRARERAIEAAAIRPNAPTLFAHICRIRGAGEMRRVGLVAPGSQIVGRVNDRHIPGPTRPGLPQ